MNLKDLYERILIIRLFESKLDSLFKRGLVHGTAHLCTGQEYIPSIISSYLTKEDSVTSTHRGHGHALSKGLDTRRFLAELLGKNSGYCSGKGGTQHVLSKEHNFYANGITGGMIPVAVGIAFANKYLGKNNITVAYLGDGGFNEGYVNESLNLASVLKLPILFVCENNQYAMSTPMKNSHSNPINERAKALNIMCEVIHDNDFKKLDSVAKRFIDEIREKKGPGFIEVATYRHGGHSKNDLNLYRNKEEEQAWIKRDVLKAIETELMLAKQLTEDEATAIKKKHEDSIDRIAEEVIKLPDNNPKDVLKNVYSEQE